eukprot:2028537-Pyramimonas_sp.AAC.2
MERLLDTDLFEASGVDRPSAGGSDQCALHGQGGDASDVQSEEGAAHSMERRGVCSISHFAPSVTSFGTSP